MQIVAFTGTSRSGKDTAARFFVDHGWLHYKFADPIKAMLRTLLNQQGVSAEDATRMLEGDQKEIHSRFLCGRTPRHAMQTLGTEWGRELMSPLMWVANMQTRIDMHGDGACIVISDVRFETEVTMLKRYGAEIWRIERDTGVSPECHPSERDIYNLDVGDRILPNFTTVEAFNQRVRATFANKVFA